MKSKNLLSQTLLEVVLAVGLSIAVLAALVILAAVSIRTVNSALARTTAAKLANSGIEAARYYRDSGSFLESGKCYKVDTALGLTELPCSSSDSILLDGKLYGRKISVEIPYDGDDRLAQVTSAVSWTDAGGLQRDVVITTVFDNE